MRLFSTFRCIVFIALCNFQVHFLNAQGLPINGTVWAGISSSTAGPSTFTTLPASVAPGASQINISQWDRGNTVYTAASGTYNSSNWSTGSSLTAAQSTLSYVYFTVTNSSVYSLRITNILVQSQSSGTGPNYVQMQCSMGGSDQDFGTTLSSFAHVTPISLSFDGNITIPPSGAATFKLYGWGAGNSSGTLRINDNSSITASYFTPCTGFPSATTATSSTISACVGIPFTLDLSGGTADSGLLYQWQSSASAGGSWTDISGATNATYTTTQTTSLYYRNNVTCAVSGLSASSSSVLVSYTPAMSAGPIIGSATVCTGSMITLSDTAAGGVWSSSNNAIASVNATTGVVTGGNTAGAATISYSIGCGTAATKSITNILAPAITISSNGANSFCKGSSISLSNSVAGGTFSSSNTSIATINSVTRLVTGVAPGTAIFTYTTGCGTDDTIAISVKVPPSPIIGGSTTICSGSIVSLSDTASYGTWSSTVATRVSVNSITGVVTGAGNAGAATISYTTGCGTAVGKSITNVLAPAVSTGANALCLGTSTALSNTVTGGSWSSGSPSIASVNNAGSVTGLAAGVAIISYSTGCGTDDTIAVRVKTAPGTISGPSSVCTGATVTFTNSVAGGTWSTTNSLIASVISTSGVVTGRTTAGTANISYSTGCGTAVGQSITNILAPAVTTGLTTICRGSIATLTNSVSGGSWTSSAPYIASINLAGRVVFGVSEGVAVITFSTGCGVDDTIAVRVKVPPSIITGVPTICSGVPITFTDSISGGTWSSSNTSSATVNSASGFVVGGATSGAAVISYSTGCGTAATYSVTNVGPLPTISGNVSVCQGGSTLFRNTTTGGVWSSGDTTIATVSDTGMVTGVAAGVATITYSSTSICGTVTKTKTITILPLPDAGSLSGPASVCRGAQATLTATVAGGIWSSNNNTVASISSGGVVTGVSGGNTIITYSVSNSCGVTAVTTGIAVDTFSNIGTITGPYAVGVDSDITLTAGVSGGIWSSSDTQIISVDSGGVVHGLSLNSAYVFYTIYNSCGSVSASKSVTVLGASVTADCPYWAIKGAAALSGPATSVDIATDGGGVPYIVYADSMNGYKATVKKYVSGDWEPVGSAGGISAGKAYFTSIAIDTGGAPYIAYLDSANNGKATVMKYSGGAWTTVGSVGFSADQAYFTSIAITSSGTPYVVYSDWSNSGKATVKKYNGSAWVTVGSIGLSTGYAWSTKIAIDPTGIPYVVFADGGNGGKATIKKYNGATWGGITVSDGPVDYNTSSITIAINSVGVPYVAYSDLVGLQKAIVKKYNGSTFVQIGSAASGVNVAYTDLVIGNTDTPYIAFVDNAFEGRATVKKYDGGQWVTIGNRWITDGAATSTKIAIGASGIPYVAYQNNADNYKVRVMSFTPCNTLAGIQGADTICIGSTATLTNSTSGGSWSSSNVTVATIDATGVVTGVTAGNAIISYTVIQSGDTAFVTHTINVPANPVPTITGAPATLYVGELVWLSVHATGAYDGVWSSSNNAIASVYLFDSTVASYQKLKAMSIGDAYIYHSLSNVCGTSTDSALVSVIPGAASITGGSSSICAGSSVAFSCSTPGGVWSTSNALIAVADPVTGVVTGISAGTVTVFYSLVDAGGPSSRAYDVTVDVSPNAGVIFPNPVFVREGDLINLSSTGDPGYWISSNVFVDSVYSSGAVKGRNAGVATVSYIVGNSCGYASAIAPVYVFAPGIIIDSVSACTSGSITLTAPAGGGIWTSANESVAIVDGSSGVLTGVAQGSALISYTVINSSGTHYYFTLVHIDAPVYASIVESASSICAGSNYLFSASGTGGMWTSSNPSVAAVDCIGTVTGVSAGNSTITYSVTNGCGLAFDIRTVTIDPLPDAGVISGFDSVCASATTIVSTTGLGGVWSSSDAAIASVSASGMVTGVSAGAATITYTVTTGCGTSTATQGITVNPLPDAGVISGLDSVCESATTSLFTTGIGGTWSSSNSTIASVSASGVVTGVSPGAATISYSVTNGCGTAVTINAKIVNPLPDAGTVSGASSVCASATTTLSTTGTVGTWSSSNAAIASVGSSGMVTGVSAGAATITYSVSNGCGTNTATKIIAVNSTPDAGAIIGATAICPAATISLSNIVSGGAWSSSNSSVATVSSTGVVTGIAAGSSTISYTVNNGCSSAVSTALVTINTVPTSSTISGTTILCIGTSASLSASSVGGTWSSNNANVSINGSTGVITGLSAGTSVVSYTLSTDCGSVIDTVPIRINAFPSSISGPSTVCIGAAITLSNLSTGGIWSASNAKVAVNSATGVVTGVTAGAVTITYTGCGSSVTFSVTVIAAPAAITGINAICAGAVTTFTNTTAGGIWTTSDPAIATVNFASSGIVTGVAAGATTIVYSIGSCSVSRNVTVSLTPSPMITPVPVCVGTTVSLSNAVAGGMWTSSTPARVTITTNGVVSALSAGTSTITYSIGSCRLTVLFTVNPTPVAISGTGVAICAGTATTFTDITAGGTWSTADAGIATVTGSSPGIVTGVGSGTTSITYAIGSCFVTKPVTVNPAPAAMITPAPVCVGAVVTLSNPVSGGTWTSAYPARATVSAFGVVTALVAGTSTISYSLGSCRATALFTVNPTPAAITGTSALCQGSTATLNDVTAGGTWTSSNPAIVSINTSSPVGVSGISVGGADITYSLGSCYAIRHIDVATGPVPMATPDSVCVGAVTTLTNPIPGGVWTSTYTARATISPTGGVATALAAGTSMITYSIASCVSTALFTIKQTPAAITGISVICNGAVATLSNTVSGGVWSTTAAGIATVNIVSPTSAIITGLSTGNATIKYAIGNCQVTRLATVNVQPAPITSPTSVCIGTITTLTNSVSGGTWSSTYTARATVAPTSGVLTALAAGPTTISYTIGSCRSTAPVTIIANPPAISGASSLCAGSMITLTNSLSGGLWSTASSAATVTSSGVGAVTSLVAGTATITYSVSGCLATKTITVSNCGAKEDLTGSGVEQRAGNINVFVFPNPATNMINIKASVPVNVKLFTQDGKLVMSQLDAHELAVGQPGKRTVYDNGV